MTPLRLEALALRRAGLSYREIATQLGINQSTARTRVYYALNKRDRAGERRRYTPRHGRPGRHAKDERNRLVYQRWMDGMSGVQIARLEGLSEPRIHQIIKRELKLDSNRLLRS